MRALQISDDNNTFRIGTKEPATAINGTQLNNEIQCRDISQSQMSPVIQPQNVQKLPTQAQQQPQLTNMYQSTMQVPVDNTNVNINNTTTATATATAVAVTAPAITAVPPTCNLNQTPNTALNASAFGVNSGMRQDTYQRTLEYVQNCRSWAENTEAVSSTSNMKINDMSTSLSSLLEENRYYNSVI